MWGSVKSSMISPSFTPPNIGVVINKVNSNFNYYLPFCQHAPSLKNARQKIYSNIDHFTSDGIGFFNILAFRGIFFGSPFAKSDQYQWFLSLDDWNHFRAEGIEEATMDDHEEMEYYVIKHCYSRSQKDRSLDLLRLLESMKFMGG